MKFILPLILCAAVVSPLFFAYWQKMTGRKAGVVKRSIIFNISAFAVVALVGLILPIGGLVSAASAASTMTLGTGFAYLAAAIATGASGIGGGIAVATGSSAAIGAITEDPKVFGKALLFVGLGEGIALYGFVIGIMIVTSL